MGRSAAGRALDPKAIELAIVASVRHADTPYDELLMSGMSRIDARERVRPNVGRVLDEWTKRDPASEGSKNSRRARRDDQHPESG